MKFIESTELRDWVKDSLKKTIFQKAHALAVQTGCEVLVKLHDTAEITGCQYYATSNLRRIYKTSKLRQPGESMVSGETGMPLTDKCIQYEDEPVADTNNAMQQDEDNGPIDLDIEEEPEPLPMQITSTNYDSQTQGTQSDIQITHMSNQRHLLGGQVQVKQEVVQQQGFSQQQSAIMQPPQQQHGQVGAYSFPISPKPYQCSICRKAFKSVHVLQKHTMTFHMPGGGGSGVTRGRGRGSRGSKPRGRGRGMGSSRPAVVQQSFQSPPMPVIKPEVVDQTRYTCIMCNQTFEQSQQLNEHMSQCPMAPGSSQGAPSDPSTSQFSPQAVAPSEEQQGFVAASGEFPQESPPTTSAANWSFPPPDGAPPSGVPVSGASAYFGQQSPSFGATTQSPGQSPRSSAGGSSRDIKDRSHIIRTGGPNFGASTAMTKHNIMSAILKTKGPAVTHRVVNCSYTFLRMLTAKQFMTASTELESMGLGTVISLKSAGRPTYLFVKRPPEEVAMILEASPDLCTLGYYTTRYELPISKIMGSSVRGALLSTGVIPMHLH